MAITISEFTPSSGNSGSPITSNSKSCTASSALFVIFYCDEWNTAPIPTCTVTGATEELVVSHRPDTSTPRLTCWVVPDIPGGTTSVEIGGFSGTRNWQIQVVELLGAATSSPIDAFDSHHETSSSQSFYGGPSGGIAIASGAIAFSIAGINNDPGSLTPDTGWTAITGVGTGTGHYLKTAYKVFTSGGSSERGLQQGAANDRIYVGLIASIKEAAGGGGGSVVPLGIITPNQTIALSSATRRST